MEERLRTARILASDDEEDEEHVARRRRTRTQIERDLNNPKVHKRIVENLYFAYKMRVRRRRRRRRLAFSRVRRRKQNLSKSFRCALAFIGVLGLNDLAPPPSHFPRTILWVVSLNDGRRPRSQRSDVPLRRARAPRSIDRRRLPPVERERERTTWKDPRDLSRWGKGRDRQEEERRLFFF